MSNINLNISRFRIDSLPNNTKKNQTSIFKQGIINFISKYRKKLKGMILLVIVIFIIFSFISKNIKIESGYSNQYNVKKISKSSNSSEHDEKKNYQAKNISNEHDEKKNNQINISNQNDEKRKNETYLKSKSDSLNKNLNKRDKWEGSEQYWKNRYETGGNSGAGSYNNLALFKAKIINNFVIDNNISSVLEWGSGDGNQLLYANYPNYIGVDVSDKAINLCKKKFEKDKSKRFIQMNSTEINPKLKGDLVLSLDVIFHLIEDDIFNLYMQRLFNSALKYVCIYSSNYEMEKTNAAHVRHRNFTKWIEKNVSEGWKLKKFIANEYPFNPKHQDKTSFSDFYFYERKIL